VSAAGEPSARATPIPEHLQSLLDAARGELGPFGRDGRVVASTRSTNDDALAWAAAGASEGAWIVAGAQSAGRGRRGRVWASPPGAGLYVSVVFRPRPVVPPAVPGDDPGMSLLTVMAGVAAVEAIADATGVRATLKWPNDVVVEAAGAAPRKLAGILAEGVMTGSRLSAVVLGLGVNLRPSAYPPEIAARAVSLEALAGRTVDADGVLVAILAALARRRRALAEPDGSPALLEAWRAWSPSATGARIRWRQQDQICEGVTAGIDDAGALRVRMRGGETRLVAGEVEWA
jgi:BirA family transcriptional regulator, biotin operon repressor / biotin---[acetyl-CoA-carboxylase] ligase